MYTEHVLRNCWCSFRVNKHGIYVFDGTKTITPKSEIVCSTTSTSITKIESLFAVVWWSWIAIWHSHLTE